MFKNNKCEAKYKDGTPYRSIFVNITDTNIMFLLSLVWVHWICICDKFILVREVCVLRVRIKMLAFCLKMYVSVVRIWVSWSRLTCPMTLKIVKIHYRMSIHKYKPLDPPLYVLYILLIHINTHISIKKKRIEINHLFLISKFTCR